MQPEQKKLDEGKEVRFYRVVKEFMQKYYDCSADKLSSSTSNLSYTVAFHFFFSRTFYCVAVYSENENITFVYL